MAQDSEEAINYRKREADSAYTLREARADLYRTRAQYLRGEVSGPKRRSRFGKGFYRSAARRLRRKNYKRMLLMQMILASIFVAFFAIAVGKHVPYPSNFIAVFTVFLMLSIAAQFGDEWARLAVAFGWIFILGMALSVQDGKPRGILFVNAISNFFSGGGQQQAPAPPPGEPVQQNVIVGSFGRPSGDPFRMTGE